MRLYRIVKTAFKKLRSAPGQAVTVEAENTSGTLELPYYQLPGISAGPTDGDKAVVVNIAGFRIVIASHNYRAGEAASAGEVVIYSTDSGGDAAQARIKLNTDGNIDLNGTGRTLVTHAELDTAIQGLVSYINGHTHSGVTAGSDPSGPPAAPTSVDISAAEAETLRTGT